jgi:hypothetical protein
LVLGLGKRGNELKKARWAFPKGKKDKSKLKIALSLRIKRVSCVMVHFNLHKKLSCIKTSSKEQQQMFKVFYPFVCFFS